MLSGFLLQVLHPSAQATCVVKESWIAYEEHCRDAIKEEECLRYSLFCDWNGGSGPTCLTKKGKENFMEYCSGKSEDECHYNSFYCIWSSGADGDDPTVTPTLKPNGTTQAYLTPTNGKCLPCEDGKVDGEEVNDQGYCTRKIDLLKERKCEGKIWYPCNIACHLKELCAETCHKLGIRKCDCGQVPSTSTTTTTATTFPGNDALIQKVLDHFDRAIPDNPDRSSIMKELLIYETHNDGWQPSRVYKKPDLLKGIRIGMETGVGPTKLSNFKQVEGANEDKLAIYAAVNVAAFLGQAMQETIRYDACDDNNWDSATGPYFSASACGPLDQDNGCPASSDGINYECQIDPDMEIMALHQSEWWGAPPLFCAPKTKIPFAPLWTGDCGLNQPEPGPNTVDELKAHLDSNLFPCISYPGQKAGRWSYDNPLTLMKTGRTDVQGCCWWGRGVIQKKGPCNFGKLNYFLGARAADEGRHALYPDLDFCKNPEAICTSTQYPELKWIAGFFHYTSAVQSWNDDEFNYEKELVRMVNGGFKDREAFMDKVSGIVNRGCPRTTCPTGQVDALKERNENFEKVLKALGFVGN